MNFKKTITAALVIAAMAGTVTPVAQNIAPAFNTTSITAEAAENTADMGTVWMTDSNYGKNIYYFNANCKIYSNRDLSKTIKAPNVVKSGEYRTFVEFFTVYGGDIRIAGRTKDNTYIPVCVQQKGTYKYANHPYKLYVNAFVYVNKVSKKTGKLNIYERPSATTKVMNSVPKDTELRITYLSSGRNWGYAPDFGGWVDLTKVRG